MTHINRVRLSKLSLGLMVALAAAPVFAQNTSAGVAGRVLSADSQPVAGAEVTIVHTESGTVSKATTDAAGRYNARGLRVGGPYTVTINKAGAGSSSREGVYLALDQVSQLDVQLSNDVATLDTVQVVGSGATDVFNPNKMGTGTEVTNDELNAFASIRRDLQDYARLDPRVVQTTSNFGEASISVAGQNNRYNSVTIDGVTTNDTFGLEGNGLPTAKQPISIDAIDSVQINVSNYDVTQTGYTGANINAVTKSGTNEFHGTLSYVFRNDNLAGDRYNRITDRYFDPPKFEETTKGITFGGPLIKDRLFFFMAYEEFASSRTVPDFGPLGSSSTNVGITQADIDTFTRLGSRPCGAGVPPTCGMDLGTFNVPGGTELTVEDALLKFDWNITDNHRASLRYNKTEQAEPFFYDITSTQLSLSSHWTVQTKVFESAVAQLFSDWTENFSTELKFAKRTYDSEFNNGSNLPEINVQFLGIDPTTGGSRTRTLIAGAERSRHFNQLNTDTTTAFFGANWYVGDHVFKFGADYDNNDIFNAFQQNTKGNYTFQCLLASQCANSFEAGRPFTFTSTQPQAGRTLNDGAAIWGLSNIGLFAQDTWTVNPNLTLMFGIRVDVPGIDEAPLFNQAAANPVTLGVGPFGRQTGGFGFRNDVTIDGKELIQPRFGFNYSFDTERRSQLRGGLGLFQGAAANVWLSNSFTNTGLAVQSVGCGGSLPACSGPVFSNDPNNQPRPFNSPPVANVDIVHPDLGQPAVWKANLGFEHELPWWGVVGSIEAIWTETKEAIYYQNLNLGEASRISPTDGRSQFWNASGYNRACFNANGSTNTTACGGANSVRSKARSNAAFGNVLLARPTGKGGGASYTLALTRPMRDDWSWMLAYTNTNATEVSGLTNSTSNSQWGNRASFNPNEEVESTSNYEIRHRFSANASWRHNFFGDYKTEVGLFYEGRSGRPYSWTYLGDMNGDGVSFNDLMYIPTGIGSNEVIFRGGPTEEARFWEIVNANKGLWKHAGGVVPRNSDKAPWVNQFDMRISQQLPGIFSKHRTVLTLDLLNIGNLINKDWGHVDEAFFPASNRNFVNYVGTQDGKYVYSLGSLGDLQNRQARGESSWAAQVTLRYEF